VAKEIRIANRRVDLQLDFFNLFNNANKFTTNTNVSIASFGSLNNADEPFAVQAGVRYTW
jgi:hypothetical protein